MISEDRDFLTEKMYMWWLEFGCEAFIDSWYGFCQKKNCPHPTTPPLKEQSGTKISKCKDKKFIHF